MSFFVTRPPRPVPATCETSTPCSAAMRATTGETKRAPLPAPSGPGPAGSVAAEGSAGGSGSAAGVASASGSGAATGSGGSAGSALGAAAGAVAPSGAIRASFVPTATVSPSGTRICCTTPLAGLGTSVSTLSVEISRRVSSASMDSPSALAHFVIVPSETETPIWGMTTSTSVSVAISTRPAP